MRDLIKPDLLIFDDFEMKKMGLEMTKGYLEVIEERYHHKSKRLKFSRWLLYANF